MSEIQLNCLAVPRNLVGNIRVQDVVVVKINDKEPIQILREEIRKKYSPLFDNIPITKFELRSIKFTDNAQALLTCLNRGVTGLEGQALNPIDEISECFPKDISKKDITL